MNRYEFISFTFLQSVDITPLLCDVDKKDKSGMARLKVQNFFSHNNTMIKSCENIQNDFEDHFQITFIQC